MLAVVAGLGLGGCAPTTRVILLPDADGEVGAITIRTAGNTSAIDRPYTPVTTLPLIPWMWHGGTRSEAEIERDYARLIEAQPPASVRVIVYFEVGTTTLVESSRARIPAIVAGVKSQLPTELTLIGHTDTTGPDSLNTRLARQRAEAIEKLLRSALPQDAAITMQSFGSRVLLVPTPPNVDEPRNRSVEILVL